MRYARPAPRRNRRRSTRGSRRQPDQGRAGPGALVLPDRDTTDRQVIAQGRNTGRVCIVIRGRSRMLRVSRGRCACRLRSAYLGLLMTHAAHSPGYRFDSCAASACAPAVPFAITAALRIPHQARIPGEARGTAAGRGSPATGPWLLYPSYAARHNPRLHRFRPDLRSRRSPQNEAHGPTAPAPVILPNVQPAGQAMKSESVRIDADTPFSVMLSFSP